MQHFPEIITGNFLLRKIQPEDHNQVFLGLSHPDVIRYYGVSYDSPEAAKIQMQWYDELLEKNTGIWWAICNRENDVFYGAAGFNNILHEHRKAETGFWLFPQFQGRRIIPSILPVILKVAEQRFNLHRTEAQVESENIASRKVLLKSGFKYEGTLQDAEIKTGRFISLDMFAYIHPVSQPVNFEFV